MAYRHKKNKKHINLNERIPNKNGRVYPESLDFKLINTKSPSIDKSPSLVKVIALFIRNKVIKILTLISKILLGVIGVVLIMLLGYVLALGIGWILKLFPNMDAYTCANLGGVSLVIMFVLMVVAIAVYATVRGLAIWIRSNWRKANQGVKVKFFED